jgi:hypothetical protein
MAGFLLCFTHDFMVETHDATAEAGEKSRAEPQLFVMPTGRNVAGDVLSE